MGTYTVVDTDKGNFICLRSRRILESALYLVLQTAKGASASLSLMNFT